ncbi:hypothetical protein KPC83_02930 [Collinsella sp. zg1085]|uniref:hypothetical protein n=1 Tax=Collinsella sp. zg1085 TaxID=2844380 RepID=UPI001C0B8FEA|nr:hypothetical protein [Collinsella sp. zg1085]QWT18099.1 hypothetical protein KPC83_02930 [Collinsella sp. zg1085]
MARAKCEISFGRFRWDRAGYAELMSSEDVQALLTQPAKSIEESCNDTFTPAPNETGKGYVARAVKGRLARGYRVSTASPHAHYSERKHNRLLRALHSQGSS